VKGNLVGDVGTVASSPLRLWASSEVDLGFDRARIWRRRSACRPP